MQISTNPVTQHGGPQAGDAVHDNWHGPHADSTSDGTERQSRRGLFRRRGSAPQGQAPDAQAPTTATGPITEAGPVVGSGPVTQTGPVATAPGPPPPGSPFDGMGNQTQIMRPERVGPSGLRSREMRAYVAAGEQIVLQQRQHSIVIAEPIITSVVALLFIGVVSSQSSQLGTGLWIFFIGWLILVMRAIEKVWDWQVQWFVVTDQRVMRAQGVFTRKIGMLPLGRVTDMSFTKPLPGRILRYGTFIFESAGQDQALREIKYVRQPDTTYGIVVRELFGKNQNEN